LEKNNTKQSKKKKRIFQELINKVNKKKYNKNNKITKSDEIYSEQL